MVEGVVEGAVCLLLPAGVLAGARPRTSLERSLWPSKRIASRVTVSRLVIADERSVRWAKWHAAQ